jgi:multidrug resistance efflux pump
MLNRQIACTMAESELYEATDRVNELQSQISSAQAQKRKTEGDLKGQSFSGGLAFE